MAKYYFAILVWKVFNLQIVHSFRKIFAHILFVEAHRWGDWACSPVDHDDGEEIIQTELPIAGQRFSTNTIKLY